MTALKSEGVGRALCAPEQAPVMKSTAGSSGALYRASGLEWQECEIVECRPDGVVLREVGRALPGVWLAPLHCIRIPGLIFEEAA
jgi:hypothetical protein